MSPWRLCPPGGPEAFVLVSLRQAHVAMDENRANGKMVVLVG